MTRKLQIGLAALFVLSALTLQTAMGQLPKQITEIEGITEYRLDNGVQDTLTNRDWIRLVTAG